MKYINSFIITFALLSLTACEKEQATPLPNFEQLVMEQYIKPFKNAETERWMEVFADDAVGMHNTLPPFVGKESIRQFADIVATNLVIEQMDIVIDNVRVNGNWALTRGSFTSLMVPKNIEDRTSVKPSVGKFILLWEKQEDQQWKVILDMGNSNQPPGS